MLELRKGDYLPEKGAYRIVSGAMITWKTQIDGNIAVLGLWGKDDVLSNQLISGLKIECLSNVTLEESAPQDSLDSLKMYNTLLFILGHRLVAFRLKLLFIWLAERFGTPQSDGILLDFPITSLYGSMKAQCL